MCDGLARSYNWILLALGAAHFAAPGRAVRADGAGLCGGISDRRHHHHDRADAGDLEHVAPAARSGGPAAEAAWCRPGPGNTSCGAGFRPRCRSSWCGRSTPCSPTPTCWCCSSSGRRRRSRHYYAAVKTLMLVGFIHFSVSAAVAHRFTALHVAGDRAELAAFVAQIGALDVLAVACRNPGDARARQADALAVRPGLRRGLSC